MNIEHGTHGIDVYTVKCKPITNCQQKNRKRRDKEGEQCLCLAFAMNWEIAIIFAIETESM